MTHLFRVVKRMFLVNSCVCSFPDFDRAMARTTRLERRLTLNFWSSARATAGPGVTSTAEIVQLL